MMWQLRWLLLFVASSSCLQSVYSFHLDKDDEISHYEIPDKSVESITTRESDLWKIISIQRQVKRINDKIDELIHKLNNDAKIDFTRPKREVREEEILDAMEKIIHRFVHNIVNNFRDSKEQHAETKRLDLNNENERSILSNDKVGVIETRGKFTNDDDVRIANHKGIRIDDQKLHDIKQTPSVQNKINVNKNEAQLSKSPDLIKNNISVPSAADNKTAIPKELNVITKPEINKSNVNTAATNNSNPIKGNEVKNTANVSLSNNINSPTQPKSITSNNMTTELQKPIIKRTPDIIINANRKKRLDLKRDDNHEKHSKEMCSQRMHANYAKDHGNDYIYKRHLENAAPDLMKKRYGRHIDETDDYIVLDKLRALKNNEDNAAFDSIKKRSGRNTDDYGVVDTLSALNNDEKERHIPIISDLVTAPKVLPKLQDIVRDTLGHVLGNYSPRKERLAYQDGEFD